MGKHWEEFKDQFGNKLVGVGMILFDLVVLLVFAGAMILADDGREWLTYRLGEGSLFTRITLLSAEALIDLTAILTVLGWLREEVKRIFK
ncbi:hypothetical protein [Terracidiphilus gabretensis]|uniref:hypothetical protein n=1 Tax=Terracidiphilus gabretensis TaxID=1577687 RepID=UPI00071B7BAB|nr:hypothetical protein [Terracidiphilus gabretensis]